jgi:hypothetical protein
MLCLKLTIIASRGPDCDFFVDKSRFKVSNLNILELGDFQMIRKCSRDSGSNVNSNSFAAHHQVSEHIHGYVYSCCGRVPVPDILLDSGLRSGT